MSKIHLKVNNGTSNSSSDKEMIICLHIVVIGKKGKWEDSTQCIGVFQSDDVSSSNIKQNL